MAGWPSSVRTSGAVASNVAPLIISHALAKHIEHFDLVDGVWVAHPRCALAVAVALRQPSIEKSRVRGWFNRVSKPKWSRSTST